MKTCSHPLDQRTPLGGFGKSDAQANAERFFCRACQQHVTVTLVKPYDELLPLPRRQS